MATTGQRRELHNPQYHHHMTSPMTTTSCSHSGQTSSSPVSFELHRKQDPTNPSRVLKQTSKGKVKELKVTLLCNVVSSLGIAVRPSHVRLHHARVLILRKLALFLSRFFLPSNITQPRNGLGIFIC
ncbi:hypothetical protein L1987_53264 [Smallanthus sonchifolius]|uniref:Uncharacterized protein n=1 Tax=Smallanthus sonchifolius TaxID=185202 RepID=A0ACB9EWL8_9ASTR|nr:hypothetical protein L1987_53264 [Smallanthus sonchifolius]